MKQYVVDRFTDEIRDELASRYRVAAEDLTDLGGFESFVFEADIDGRPTIIKLGHEDRRSLDMLLAEAEFTRFLAAQGIGVAAAVESPQGNLVETIDDGVESRFMAVAWTTAAGDLPSMDVTDPVFWHAHGRLVGQIHAATSSFTPSTAARMRPDWDAPTLLDDSFHIPESDPKARRETQRLLSEMRTFDRGVAGYGLVHYDAHLYNVHVHSGRLTLFDFDDCGYTWFANDLAVVMYHSLMRHDDPAARAEIVGPAFISGYRSSYDLDPHWFRHFPTFLSWRDHLLYSVICRSRDSIDDMDVDAWIERFATRHESDAPLIDYDFTIGTR
jgi:Ser/Thr protein kinase RdoA (MazF antagonist)